jgi:hypothetical protein
MDVPMMPPPITTTRARSGSAAPGAPAAAGRDVGDGDAALADGSGTPVSLGSGSWPGQPARSISAAIGIGSQSGRLRAS